MHMLLVHTHIFRKMRTKEPHEPKKKMNSAVAGTSYLKHREGGGRFK